jgi:lipopolysaccharide transport system ATP-binding protein
MSDTVINVENLSNKYLISHLADKSDQLFSRLLVNKAEDLVGRGKRALSSPLRINHSPFTDSTEEFWALKDVSFEIKQGDRRMTASIPRASLP